MYVTPADLLSSSAEEGRRGWRMLLLYQGILRFDSQYPHRSFVLTNGKRIGEELQRRFGERFGVQNAAVVQKAAAAQKSATGEHSGRQKAATMGGATTAKKATAAAKEAARARKEDRSSQKAVVREDNVQKATAKKAATTKEAAPTREKNRSSQKAVMREDSSVRKATTAREEGSGVQKVVWLARDGAESVIGESERLGRISR